MDNPTKTPIARHQNVAQHISSNKSLSTKTMNRQKWADCNILRSSSSHEVSKHSPSPTSVQISFV